MTAYAIEFAESVKTHLAALTTRQRTTVLDAIERQLVSEPLKETRIGNLSDRIRSHRGNCASVTCVYSMK